MDETKTISLILYLKCRWKPRCFSWIQSNYQLQSCCVSPQQGVNPLCNVHSSDITNPLSPSPLQGCHGDGVGTALFLGYSVFFLCDLIFSSLLPPSPLSRPLLLRRPYFEMKAKYYLQLEVRDGCSAVIYFPPLDHVDHPWRLWGRCFCSHRLYSRA